MKIELEKVLPRDIERRSFEIIEHELQKPIAPDLAPVIKRVIHTTADFDYASNLYFSDGVIEHALNIFRSHPTIVTDTTMAMAGINKRTLSKLGGRVLCYIGDDDVAETARIKGITRSAASMDKAAESLDNPIVFAIGNAPTALIRLYEHIAGQHLKPDLIIGVPVGFVNVIQSKELIMSAGVPCIVAKGRKGGSNVAAAICNALMYMLEGR